MTADQRDLFAYTTMYIRHHAASLVRTINNPVNVDDHNDDAQSDISDHSSMPDLELQGSPPPYTSNSVVSSPRFQLPDLFEEGGDPVAEEVNNPIPSDYQRYQEYLRTTWPIVTDSGSVFFHMTRNP